MFMKISSFYGENRMDKLSVTAGNVSDKPDNFAAVRQFIILLRQSCVIVGDCSFEHLLQKV